MDPERKTPPAAEREAYPEKIRKTLARIVELRKHARGELEPSTEVETELKALPEAIQESIAEDVERYKAYGLDQTQLDHEIQRNIEIAKNNYVTKPYAIPNKVFSRTQAKSWVDQCIDEVGDEVDSLNSVVRISMDVNGLKSVNDLNGTMEKGQEYLLLFSQILEDPSLRDVLEQENVRYVPSAEGGDEFGIVLKGEEPLTPEFIEQVTSRIEELLAASDEISGLLNFEDEKIQYSYAGYSEREWRVLALERKKTALEELQREIPEGYRYQAHVSIGVASLYDAVAELEVDDGMEYEQVLDTMNDRMYEMSDERGALNKDAFKERIRESDNPHEFFLSQIYARTKNERQLQTENKERQDCIHAIRNLLSGETTPEELGDLIAEYESGGGRYPEVLVRVKRVRGISLELVRQRRMSIFSLLCVKTLDVLLRRGEGV